MSVKVASEWLNSCSGCEISLVDMGEKLLDVLNLVDFVHIPVLMDNKYYGQLGDGKHLTIPEADVGIISGSIRNEEHLEIALEMRKKCKIIVALGTCATHGGIPALSNSFTNDELMERYYSTETTEKSDCLPSEGIPALLDSCYSLDEKIKVDLCLPGCAPHPDQVFEALVSLLEGRAPNLADKSVCDTCPAIRKGKGEVKKLRRFLEQPYIKDQNKPLEEMRCLLEQGFLCMGPVTHAGCGGDKVTPRCITALVPCRGCNGPVKHGGNQMLDMLNALASNGIDIDSLPERTSLLRFSGANSKLRPKLVQKESV